MEQETGTVLVVEDDRAVRYAVDRALTFEGYTVNTARDGAEALAAVVNDPPDVIVLDVMMPHVDGLETCRRIRARGIKTPILILTARHEISDRVAGLDAGADDYMVKPFALEELLARLRALLRRSSGSTTEVLAAGDLTLNAGTREVKRGNFDVNLTKTEFDLLELLVRNAGIVLDRGVIYEKIWGYDFETTSNSLDVYIGYLRRKTEPEGSPRLIHTVRGVGYVVKLRTRIALTASIAVAIAVVLASIGAYFAARNELRDQVDESLIEVSDQARGFQGLLNALGGPGLGRGRVLQPRNAFDALYIQALLREGVIVPAPGQELSFPVPVPAPDRELVLPVEKEDIAVVNGAPSVLRDVVVDGRHLRLITSEHDFGAIQIARSLDEVDETLAGLTVVLALVSIGGTVVAAALGLVVARGALRPIARLTKAAEHVAETQELGAHIEVEREDEIGRLATSFNAMLAALEESRQQQHRLVHDAGHELRTPLTALRTNIELLAKAEGMPADQRRALLDDVTFELKELSNLVTEVVDLATDAATTDEILVSIHLDQLVDRVVERARRRTGREIVTDLAACTIEGRRAMLERAIANLIDNAVKWSPADSQIEVSLVKGRLEVRDHGPGISDVDRTRIFDRFYRAESARSTPGSGLGLSIVKRVAEDHDGSVHVQEHAEGGAVVGFTVPSSHGDSGQ